MPNPTHHQTDKSQFADDSGQWAVSKNIDLAVEYLQRDLDKLANQSSDILQHSQNRPTGDRWLKF